MKLVAIVAAILLGSSGYAAADSLTVGEVTGFRGVFCKTVEAADRVFTAETQTAMMVQYNREQFCVLGALPVTIVEVIKQYEVADTTYTLVKVEASDGSMHYIATTMTVYKGVPA